MKKKTIKRLKKILKPITQQWFVRQLTQLADINVDTIRDFIKKFISF